MQRVIVLAKFALFIIIAGCGNKKTAQVFFPDQSSGDSLEEILELSYIGNMGVLIESHGKTVLFDGFHKEYGPDYVFPTATMVMDLQQGTYNTFSKIDVACVTHKHGDHFDSKYYESFLAKNKEALVIGPNQVTEEIVGLKSQYKDKDEERVMAIAYNNEIHSIHHQGVHVKAIQCNHVNQKRHASIENIAYVVEISGFSILHVGDTNWGEAIQTFRKLELKNGALDVAIVPYWMLMGDSSKERVQNEINPKHLIATHIPPTFTNDEIQSLMQEFTNVTLFTELGENMTYKKTQQ